MSLRLNAIQRTALFLLSFAGLVVAGFFFARGERPAELQVELKSEAWVKSAAFPETAVLVEGKGKVAARREGKGWVLSSGLRWAFRVNGQARPDLERHITERMREPVRVELAPAGHPSRLFFAHAMEAEDAEAALNLWRILAAGLFPPRREGRYEALDLWGPAGLAVSCAGARCTTEAEFSGEASNLVQERVSRYENGEGFGSARMEQKILPGMVEARTLNTVEWKRAGTAAYVAAVGAGQWFPATVESSGRRNKLRALRREFAAMSGLESFLGRISSRELAKASGGEIFSLAEAALLLFPEEAEVLARELTGKRFSEGTRRALLSAFLRAEEPAAQAALQKWLLSADSSALRRPALLQLTFRETAAPGWAATLRKLGELDVSLRSLATLTLCSLARALGDRSLVGRAMEPAPLPTEQEEAERVLCLGNAAFAEGLPVLAQAFRGGSPALRERALFALRFVKASGVEELVREAAAQPSSHPALFSMLEQRLARGIRDPYLGELLGAMNAGGLDRDRARLLAKWRNLR